MVVSEYDWERVSARQMALLLVRRALEVEGVCFESLPVVPVLNVRYWRVLEHWSYPP